APHHRSRRDARGGGGEVVGVRRRPTRGAHHAASPRRDGSRRRLSGPPLLPVGQADRGHAGRRERAARPARPRTRGGTRMTTPTSVRHDDVQVGDELPTLVIPLTRTLIVATAIASRDYQDVHHDPGLAKERGSPDIFMNILSTNGFVGRFITDWAGPDAVLKSVKIRLGAPNHPGDTMTMTGKVTEKRDGVVEVAIRGATDIGDHVTGSGAVELPRRASARSSVQRAPAS